MTRQVTDNLYIDLGYFTPEEYYVYEAVASSALSAQASLTCSADAGAVQDFSASLTATASQTANNSRIRDTTTAVTGAFSASMTVVATRNGSMDFIVVAGFEAQPERNRAVDIALDSLANINAQAQRTATTSAALSASATLAADLTEVLIVDFSAALTVTASQTAEGKGFVVSSPVVFRGVGRPEINYTTTKFGAGSLYLNGSSYLYAPDKDTRFDIPSSSGGASAGQFTVEAHIYPTSDRVALIAGQWQGNSSSTQGWKLEQSNLNITLTVRTGSSTTQSIFSTTNPLNLNAWNHIAVVRRTSAGTTDIALWVNGVRMNSASWTSASFANTGEVRIGYSGESGTTYFQGYIDALNFRVGSARYNTATTPITVPTAEYTTINSTDKILVNFNDNYLDQSTPNNVTFTAALTSTASLSAAPQKAILASAALTSTASVSAVIGKLKDFTAELPVIASQLSAVGKVGQGLVACDVVATLSADVNVITENELDFSSDFAQTANTDRLRDSSSSLSAEFAQSNDVNVVTENELDFLVDTALTVNEQRLRDFSSDLSAEFAQSAAAVRTRDVNSTQSVTVEITALLGIVKEFDSALPVIASQLSAVAKVGQGLVDCAVTATLDCDAEVTSGSVVNLTSTAQLQAQPGKLLSAQANVSATTTLTAQPEVVGTLDADLSAAFTQTTAFDRTRTLTSSVTANFAQSAAISVVKPLEATVSAQAQVSATVNRTRTLQANLPVIASQLSVASETSSAQANLTSQFTMTVTGSIVNIDPDLTYMIPKETRSHSITEELREDIIIPEVRSYTVIIENRSYSVLNTDETYII